MMTCQSDNGVNRRQRLEGACAVFTSRQVAVFLLLGARPLNVVLEVVDGVQVTLLQRHTQSIVPTRLLANDCYFILNIYLHSLYHCKNNCSVSGVTILSTHEFAIVKGPCHSRVSLPLCYN